LAAAAPELLADIPKHVLFILSLFDRAEERYMVDGTKLQNAKTGPDGFQANRLRNSACFFRRKA
jgi:hypothetical protein